MANERKTESIVRKLLEENGYYSDDNVIIEEQSSDNPKIDKLLENASKSGGGKGYPEFIISFINYPDELIIIECKADTAKHESVDRKQYKDFAVDGALLYASHLKDQFNIVAIAVSGETEREVKVSHFLWLKEKLTYKDIGDKQILTPKSLFSIIRDQSKPIREEELIKKAIEYNKTLESYAVPERRRCTLISSILVALQDNVFADSYKSHHTNEDSEGYNPNESLIESLLSSCENVLKKNNLDVKKRETIIGEYTGIRQHIDFRSKYITVRGNRRRNTILRDLIDDLNENVLPYVSNDGFDVLGKFYTQFIRYAGSDKKTGLVLTPTHITDLFCDLADLNENSKVLDPCCGTGGFLVSAMNYMLNKSGNNLNKHKKIKGNQLIGIEKESDMFSHACSNMMMRGDGKSHIYHDTCFDEELKKQISKESPDRAFLNPPYSEPEDRQLEFIENAMECISSDGICVAICQMSTVVSAAKKTLEVRKRLLEKHTLEAVLSMPDGLFHPASSVITCIIILKAGTPHPDNKETFFGYFKDDGFVKAKNKGRIDQKNLWSSTKKKWLDAYRNRNNELGLSIKKCVSADDEWCAEAYMETDYSKLTEDDFVNTIKNYVVYEFLQKSVPDETD